MRSSSENIKLEQKLNLDAGVKNAGIFIQNIQKELHLY